MAERRLRYSERKRLNETGSLGELTTEPSPELRRAVIHLLERRMGELYFALRKAYMERAQDTCEEHFGWGTGVKINGFPLTTTSIDDFLDYVEILVEVGSLSFRYQNADYYMASGYPWREAEDDLNLLFDRHRFGFRLTQGEIHAVASPALEQGVVGPTLLAVRKPGWEEVDRTFREALLHQRGGTAENDDAITAAHAALEAALKAVGLKGDRLSTLAKSLRGSELVPSQLEGVPDLLDGLLKRSSAIRDPYGTVHGKPPGSEPVPQALVNLAIHWSGSFIVYLSEAVD